MGKAGRWLRNFFLPGRKGRKASDRADTDCQSVLSAPLPTQAATPSVREKRRWSFRRPGSATGKADEGASGGQGPQGPLASSSSHCFSEAEVHVVVVQDDQHAVAEAANTAAPVASLPPPAPARGCEDEEDAAAIKIQSAFRSYLARKALCALRGMVKLQAMVRGQLVRRQANVTLRRMQALVDAQRRARAERLRLLEEEDARHQLANTNTTPRQPPSRRSLRHPRSRKPLEAVERGTEESVKIVEVDDAGVAQGGRSSSFCYSTTPGRTPAKAELYQKVSPTPSALTDVSARTLSGRFDDASFSSAWEPPRRGNAAWRADHRAPAPFATASPNYMANTESSRAKARSQSAPRQRHSSASESAAAASPSPSCCEPRPPSRGGSGAARRRASLDPLDLPAAPRSSAGRMERCASRAMALVRASVGAGASLPGSECGSSSTVGHRGSAQGAWHGWPSHQS
ncbi:hypothetical protein PAHAL_3G490000 [Panicum hallii]|uniref:DUF4005 domain-containing protein n=1 Tax=Panicum hallii TaxID=206008 RepID=A0A2S3HFA5_9POAL|nr:hypothetical protein PAHAL_3G490000 [Panicum hallii]